MSFFIESIKLDAILESSSFSLVHNEIGFFKLTSSTCTIATCSWAKCSFTSSEETKVTPYPAITVLIVSFNPLICNPTIGLLMLWLIRDSVV